MKALTVYQPWATLIALDAKPYEFRGHDYATRNAAIAQTRIAIHASNRTIQYREVVDLRDRLAAGIMAQRPNTGGTGLHARALPILEKMVAGMQGRGDEFPMPQGAIVALVTLGRAVNAGVLFKGEPTNDSDRNDKALFAWPMIDVQSVPPIPCRRFRAAETRASGTCRCRSKRSCTMPPVKKRDYPTVMVTIGEKINDMQLRGIDPAHLEIVIGADTDKVLLDSTGAIFLPQGGGEPGPKPTTMHGAKVNGFPVVVDNATPWLVTVRRKRGLGGPKG